MYKANKTKTRKHYTPFNISNADFYYEIFIIKIFKNFY